MPAVTAVTRSWTRQRRAELRDRSREINRRDALARQHRVTIKEAAWRIMGAAYRHASANGRLPANARQVMYAARPDVLRLTGRDRLDDNYFTQTLLPAYMAEHPDETADWDVVYDARGHFAEFAYRRSVAAAHFEDHAHDLIEAARKHAAAADPPSDLRTRLEAALETDPARSWQTILRDLLR